MADVAVRRRRIGWSTRYFIYPRLFTGGVAESSEYRTLWRPTRSWAVRTAAGRQRRSAQRAALQRGEGWDDA